MNLKHEAISAVGDQVKILVIGDVYGDSGLRALTEYLPILRKKYNFALVIANGENVSGGSSLLEKDYSMMKKLGIDIITSGNHIFRKREIWNYIHKVSDLLVPLNYNHYLLKEKEFLQGSIVRNVTPDFKVRVSNVIGQTFMQQHYESPFLALEKAIELDNKESFHIVDFHAEATAEKIALATFFDGELGFLYGTHTHVQTTDNRILEKGTAFITDVGMTGPYDSVIGANKKIVMKRLREGLPIKIEQANGIYQFSGVILTIDTRLRKTISIKRIYYCEEKGKKTNHFF